MKKAIMLITSVILTVCSCFNCYAAQVLPSTGDEGVQPWVYIVIAVSAVAIIAMLILGRKKDKKNEDFSDNEDKNETTKS